MDPTTDKNESAKEKSSEQPVQREEEKVPVGESEDAEEEEDEVEEEDTVSMDEQSTDATMAADPAATIYGGNIAAACEATNAVAKTISAEERLERRRTRNRLNARRNREIRRREEKLKEEKEGLRQINESLRRENLALEQEVRDLREIVRQLTSTSTASQAAATSQHPAWLSALSARAGLPSTFNNPLSNPLSSQSGLLQLEPARGLSNPLLTAQSSILQQRMSSAQQLGGGVGGRLLFPPVALPEQQRLPSLTLNDAIQSSLSRFPSRPGESQSILQAALQRGLDSLPTSGISSNDMLPPEGPMSSSATSIGGGNTSAVSQDSKEESVIGSPTSSSSGPKKKKMKRTPDKQGGRLSAEAGKK